MSNQPNKTNGAKPAVRKKKNLLDDLLKRSPNNYGKFEASVQEILNAVKEKGDEAVFDYTEKFDGVRLDAEHLLVTEEEIADLKADEQ